MNTEGTCEVMGCPKDLAVGVGNPPVWVCLDHYRVKLDETFALVRVANKTLFAVER